MIENCRWQIQNAKWRWQKRMTEEHDRSKRLNMMTLVNDWKWQKREWHNIMEYNDRIQRSKHMVMPTTEARRHIQNNMTEENDGIKTIGKDDWWKWQIETSHKTSDEGDWWKWQIKTSDKSVDTFLLHIRSMESLIYPAAGEPDSPINPAAGELDSLIYPAAGEPDSLLYPAAGEPDSLIYLAAGEPDSLIHTPGKR